MRVRVLALGDPGRALRAQGHTGLPWVRSGPMCHYFTGRPSTPTSGAYENGVGDAATDADPARMWSLSVQ